MTDDMNEKLLQEYLEGRSPVSDAYQDAAKSGPPPELDRAVLAEAQAAARASRDTGSPRWQAWLMPVSLAATVTLCIALVTEVVVFNPLLKTADSPQTFSDTFEAEADAHVPSPATAGRPSPAQEMLELKQESSALNEFARNTATATEEMPTNAAVGPARENLNAPEPTSDRRASAKDREVPEARDVATSFSTSVQPETAAADERAQRVAEPDESTSETNLIAGGVQSGGTISGTAGEIPDEVAVTVITPLLDISVWPAPDVWLAGIQILLEQGELDRAEAELVKFQKVYPDYPLGELVRGTDED